MKKAVYLFIALCLIFTISLTACGGSSTGPSSQESSAGSGQAEPVAAGEELFTANCSVCHGPQGEGIKGLGKDMSASQFIADSTDEALVEFIKVGRPPGDPLNSTGVAMPAMGNNPNLSDQDLKNIVAYIRTLQ